jgi:spermidine/putrescine transport system ATP-binding protein
VNRPAALLLDEPLGALDLKLRKEMQLELKELQARSATTFIYVTHDQEEAMTMSDRIAVMSGGVVEQVAEPRELYRRPASAFVADFIGTSNLITLRPDRREGGLVIMDLGDGQRLLAPDDGSRDPVQITVRPEWIKLTTGQVDERSSLVRATVADVAYLGSVSQFIVELPGGERLAVHRLNDRVDAADPRPGELVTLTWAADHSYVIRSNGSPRQERAAETPSTGDTARSSSGTA